MATVRAHPCAPVQSITASYRGYELHGKRMQGKCDDHDVGRWAPWLCSPCDKIVYPEHEKAVQAATGGTVAASELRDPEAMRRQELIFNTVHKADLRRGNGAEEVPVGARRRGCQNPRRPWLDHLEDSENKQVRGEK